MNKPLHSAVCSSINFGQQLGAVVVLVQNRSQP